MLSVLCQPLTYGIAKALSDFSLDFTVRAAGNLMDEYAFARLQRRCPKMISNDELLPSCKYQLLDEVTLLLVSWFRQLYL